MSANATVAACILAAAQDVANRRSAFFQKKGPGDGDRDTNDFMTEVRAEVQRRTGRRDLAERRICGDNNLAVDFYVEDEATIIEVALSLRNPNCEFERDILKALMAKETGSPVNRLLLIAKPGGEQRVNQPSSQAMVAWAQRLHGLEISVIDLSPGPTAGEGEQNPTTS